MGLIHPTAIVEDGSRLGADVTVGAFSVVGSEATLEDGVSLDNHVIIRGRTTIGARTRIAAFAVIGGEAQDLAYKGEPTTAVIGPDCVIREHVTIHRGTAQGRGTTTVGAKCFFMIGAHVAHDCVVGDNVILTNQAMLGGHSVIGNYAILGALAGVQQRCQVGAHAFVGGLTGVTRNVVPFVMATGRWARLGGINVVGLSRRGYSREAIHQLRAAYEAFFSSSGSRAERLAALSERFAAVPAVKEFADFIRASGDRPLALPRRTGDEKFGDGEGGGYRDEDDG